MRDFGRLGQVSALTLGGGGIGQVWGETDRDEAVATVHAALDAGITMLDVAPSYGPDFEAERVVGAALRARPAPDVLVTTKVRVPDDEPGRPAELIARSVHDSLRRLGRDRLDLYLLHTQLRPAGSSTAVSNTVSWEAYREEAVPVFERLVREGTIRAWGITAVGHPEPVIDAIGGEPRPDAAQVVVNALDLNGDMWTFDAGAGPRSGDILRAAGEAGVSVIGIRALAAGSLAAALDRKVDPDRPAAADFARADGFRRLAAGLGEAPAALAHRYALSVPGVATVVLGVKNRAELAECVAAEARGPLTGEQLRAVAALRADQRPQVG